MLCQLLAWWISRSGGLNAAGVHTRTSGFMKWKPAGITPTTVNGSPPTRISRPIAASGLANSCRLRPSLRIALCSAPGSPSASVKARPYAGCTRSSRHSDGVRSHPHHAQRRALYVDRRSGGAEKRLLRKRVRVAQTVEIVARSAVESEIGARPRVAVRHHEDRSGVRDGQRAQQHRIHYRERRRIGGNAHRNGQDDRERKSLVARQRADGVAQAAQSIPQTARTLSPPAGVAES